MGTWAEETQAALRSLGGRSSVAMIVEKVLKSKEYSNNNDPASSVRNVLQTNKHLFKKYGRNDWALIDHQIKK